MLIYKVCLIYEFHIYEFYIHEFQGQARECLFEKLVSDTEKRNLSQCLDIAQEAAQVSKLLFIFYCGIFAEQRLINCIHL